jgi:chorismate mutase
MGMSLQDLRRDIDDVDARIIKLLAERVKLSGEIGAEKARESKPVTDAGREAAVLEHIRCMAKDEGINADAVESIYRRVIAASKNAQGVSVAFQGEPGATASRRL